MIGRWISSGLIAIAAMVALAATGLMVALLVPVMFGLVAAGYLLRPPRARPVRNEAGNAARHAVIEGDWVVLAEGPERRRDWAWAPAQKQRRA